MIWSSEIVDAMVEIAFLKVGAFDTACKNTFPFGLLKAMY